MAVLRKGQEAGYMAEISQRMEQIWDALESLQQGNLAPVQMRDEQPDQAALAESFLLSVKNAAKPGVSLRT
jgi:hypothetical protein